MPRQYVEHLRNGQSIDEIYLLAEKQLRANRNGDLYLLVHLRDRTGVVHGLMWNITEEMAAGFDTCLLYTSPSPRDRSLSRMPSSA